MGWRHWDSREKGNVYTVTQTDEVSRYLGTFTLAKYLWEMCGAASQDDFHPIRAATGEHARMLITTMISCERQAVFDLCVYQNVKVY